MINKKNIIIALVALLIIGGLSWAYLESVKPAPGVEEIQTDRTHIPEGSKTDYKFNPPVGGAHYPMWITKGVYDLPRADGYLVHSQEHGYIIFWYDCTKKLSLNLIPNLIPTVNAQQIPASSSATPQVPAMTSAGSGTPSMKLEDMPKEFSDGSCKALKDQLGGFYNEFGQHKLIVVPRPGMAHPLIITAWNRALFLDKIDKAEIKRFIDFYRDRGPEATNEP